MQQEAQGLIRVINHGTDSDGNGRIRLVFDSQITQFVRDQLVLSAVDLMVRTRTLREQVATGKWVYSVTLCDKELTAVFFAEIEAAIRFRTGEGRFEFEFVAITDESSQLVAA